MQKASLAVLYNKLEKYTDEHIIKWTKEEYRLLNIHYSKYNRYSYRIPYERTRVKLQYKGSSHEMTYINASHVQLRNRKYIASQAPIPNTFEDFWNMIFEQKVFLIVTLLRLKGETYWPSTLDSILNFPSISIVNRFERAIISSELVLRGFRVKTKDGLYRDVYQIHYLGWPDHGVPNSYETIEKLLQMTDTLSTLHKEAPILVHCRAGIGRTGTFCVLDSIINGKSVGEQEADEKDDTVISLIKQCRNQRNGMVETYVTFPHKDL